MESFYLLEATKQLASSNQDNVIFKIFFLREPKGIRYPIKPKNL